MLKLLALGFAASRSRPSPDAEKGSSVLEDRVITESPVPDESDEDDAEGDQGEDELEEEHNTHDIIHDMEVERQEVGVPENPPLRRGRTYSSSIVTLPYSTSTSPSWWTKLKDLILPKTTTQDLDSYIPTYRYTPIISGIIIPFSILLEIPGLTERWYIRTENNQVVDTQPNPAILNIGLGVSMACALAANMCLVVRFLEKKVKLMTIGCIIFLTIHDLINITAVTIFGIEHRFNDGFTYGQSFWITVCSTAVSSFTNLTLITDLVRTPDFEHSGSGLTRRQRSLAIVVILLLTYIALGALIYSYLLHLNFIDAMYFTLVTIETVGFGDISPKTAGARVFTCFYAVFGILIIVLEVGLMRETVLEGLEVGYRKRVQAVRQRRKIGRWKRRVSNRWREAVEWRLREGGHPVWVKNKRREISDGWWLTLVDFFAGFSWWRSDGDTQSTISYGSGFMTGLGYGSHPHGMHLNLRALTWKQLEAAAMEAGVPLDMLLPEGYREERGPARDSAPDSPDSPHAHVPIQADADVPLTYTRLGHMVAMLGAFALAVNKSSHLCHKAAEAPTGGRPAPLPTPMFKPSLTSQYDKYRSSMEKEETKAFYARLTVVWALFIMFWIVGSLIFRKTEGWSFGVSIYFCFVAFTTIGFGDYSPQTPTGRSIFVVWALLGVGTMTILLSVISEAFSSKYHTVLYAGVFQRAVKRYHERARTLADKARRGVKAGIRRPGLSEHISSEELHQRAQVQLEALPHKILNEAKTFHEHVSYFVGLGPNGKPGVDVGDELPPGLQKLMDEITGAEKLGERVKREILQDEDARHTLFTLSIEQALRKMINSAEAAIQALDEREQLLQMREAELTEREAAATLQVESRSQPPRPLQTEVLTLPEKRPTGIRYTRWDTTTSSEYSDWR
ncbi:unnamed protein product [Mycena citricolor]|uniref:Potassium channel domain-containing protein n=1 Tax=Mycena citricolor TaxID=2018698 RepID=A0AAD2HCQ0_9AGAR|nr:unnamed protein product [Mycena citricolor]